jgi:hypothetical protein
MDLAEFLLARIAEDEAAATRASWFLVDYNAPMNQQFGDRFNPARVLAECAAKRRIVEQFTMIKLLDEWHDVGPAEGAWIRMQTVLQLMAAPYADHPDYRPEWAPTVTV